MARIRCVSLARVVARMAGAVALFLATSAVLCAGPGVPEPDLCNEPQIRNVVAVELGSPSFVEVFVPWQDDEDVFVVVGDQGSPMFPMRIRVQGDNAQCIPVSMLVIPDQGELLADELLLLSAYRQDDGSFVTDTHWVVLKRPFANTRVTVVLSVNDVTVMRTVVLRP